MARARNIKPGFFENEELADCTPWARLLFVGLWVLADREGRLEDRPKRIKASLFAYDAVDVEPLLVELESHGFIVRYVVDGMRAIQILHFADHQSPHYSEKPSAIKPPNSGSDGGTMGGNSGSGPPIKPPDSGKVAPIMPGQNRESSGSIPGVDPASRGGRNPLIPDSPNPDSPNPLPSVAARAAAGADNAEEPPPTPGQACKAMREVGLADVNHNDPRLREALAQGMTAGELQDAARDAVGRGKGFGYALQTAIGRRADAAKVAVAARTSSPGSAVADMARKAMVDAAAAMASMDAPGDAA